MKCSNRNYQAQGISHNSQARQSGIYAAKGVATGQRWLSCVGVTLLAGLAPVAFATEYTAGYSVELAGQYDDNVRLVVNDASALEGVVVSPVVILKARSDQLDASLNSRFDLARYSEEGFDSDDLDLQGALQYRLENTRFNASVQGKRDSTRTSELLDTGRIDNQVERKETYRAQGSVRHQLDTRNALDIRLGLRDVSYQSATLQDYQVTDAGLGWVYALSERIELETRVYASRFDVDESASVRSDTLGVQVGVDASLSESLNFSLFAGMAQVSSEYGAGASVSGDHDDDAFILGASLNYRAPRYNIGVGVDSATDPSGDGVLIKSDRIKANYRYRLTELSYFTTDLTLLTSESLDERIQNQRDYARLALGYGYQLSDVLTLSANYRHQTQKRETVTGTAQSDALYVTLRYTGKKTRW